MKSIRTWVWTAALLVVAMVTAIGGWGVYKGNVRLVPQASAQSAPLQPTIELADHLTCYLIVRKDNIPLDTNHNLTVTNQFDPVGANQQEVGTTYSRYLCVPTTKLRMDGATVVPTPLPTPHYKCYFATTHSSLPPLGVQLTDEFMTQEYTLQNSTANLFCNPVEKTVLTPTTGGP